VGEGGQAIPISLVYFLGLALGQKPQFFAQRSDLVGVVLAHLPLVGCPDFLRGRAAVDFQHLEPTLARR